MTYDLTTFSMFVLCQDMECQDRSIEPAQQDDARNDFKTVNYRIIIKIYDNDMQTKSEIMFQTEYNFST